MTTCYIIAGPNGAGKTTFAKTYLPHETDCSNFINADLIAEGLSPFKPETVAFEAARLLLRKIDDNVARNESFAFESTLSGKNYIKRIEDWKNKGYRIIILFLKLPDENMAIARVRQRVSEGGHSVPNETIKRRFTKGWRNFEKYYKGLVDEWILFDNSGETPVILEESK